MPYRGAERTSGTHRQRRCITGSATRRTGTLVIPQVLSGQYCSVCDEIAEGVGKRKVHAL